MLICKTWFCKRWICKTWIFLYPLPHPGSDSTSWNIVPLPVSHIICLFSPVTANTFFSDENDLIICPRFSGGGPVILIWVFIASKAELIFSSAVISSKGLTRFPLASGSSSQEFFEHSRHVLRSWYKIGGPEQGFPRCFADGLNRRLSLKCFAGYIETNLWSDIFFRGKGRGRERGEN